MRGRADGDRARPLEIVVLVLEGHTGALLQLGQVGVRIEFLEPLGAEVALEIDQVARVLAVGDVTENLENE